MAEEHQMLLVGTAKGLFILRGTNGKWEIDGPHFAGRAVYSAFFDQRKGRNEMWAGPVSWHFGAELLKSTDMGRRGTHRNGCVSKCRRTRKSRSKISGRSLPERMTTRFTWVQRPAVCLSRMIGARRGNSMAVCGNIHTAKNGIPASAVSACIRSSRIKRTRTI